MIRRIMPTVVWESDWEMRLMWKLIRITRFGEFYVSSWVACGVSSCLDKH